MAPLSDGVYLVFGLLFGGLGFGMHVAEQIRLWREIREIGESAKDIDNSNVAR